MSEERKPGATFTPDKYDLIAREVMRRHYTIGFAFKEEPNGMKNGGWADNFAEDIAAEMRLIAKEAEKDE